jgi:hypothetical protein
MTTLIKNGTIVTATDMYKADILVKNGIVSEIGREISKIASEIIDAADKWVLPGGVDPHTHMDSQCDGMTTVDDFETGTAAAAAGGTTTVIDYAEQAPGVSLMQTLEDWKAKAATKSIIDYGFHLALSEVNESILAEIPAAVEAGVTSFHVSLDGYGERHINDARLIEFLQCTQCRRPRLPPCGEWRNYRPFHAPACGGRQNGSPVYHVRPAPRSRGASRRPGHQHGRNGKIADLPDHAFLGARRREGQGGPRPGADNFCGDLLPLPCYAM